MSDNSSGFYTYNCKGMSEDDLTFYSTYRHTFHQQTLIESERYGCGKVLRKYCLYPSFLPIRIRNLHGPSVWDVVPDHFIACKEKYFGIYSKRLQRDFESRTTGKKAYVIPAPAWIYFKNNKQIFRTDKKGTIFFLSHSTFWTRRSTKPEDVIDFLNSLPMEMKPYSIMMHFVDVQNNSHLPYLKYDIPVFCSGNWDNKWFINNFFEIVRNYKYALGNEFGSNILYCEMIGLKTMICENIKTKIDMQFDPNYIKAIDHGVKFNRYNQVEEIFKKESGKNNYDRYSVLEEELGIKYGVSIVKFSLLLYWSYFHWLALRFTKKMFKMRS